MEAYITFNKKSAKADIVLKNCEKIEKNISEYARYVAWFSVNKVKKMVFSAFDYDPFKDDIKRYTVRDSFKTEEYTACLAARLQASGCRVYIRESRDEDKWEECENISCENALELECEMEIPEGMYKALLKLDDLTKAFKCADENECILGKDMLKIKERNLKNELYVYEKEEALRREKIKGIWI